MKIIKARFQPYLFIVLSFLQLLVIVSNSAADDMVAASCSASDIQSAIDAAIQSDGGTITIPACDAFSTWLSGDKVVATPGDTEIRILGQGTAKTRIGYAAGQQSYGAMFKFRGPGLKEFGSMHLQGDGYAESSGRIFLTLHAARDSRIHHIITENFAGPIGTLCGTHNVVIDHCTFNAVLYSGTYHWYVYGDNDYLDDWTDNFGTENYNVFFEDCLFRESHHPVSTFTAGSAVIRHNTFSFGITDSGYSNVIDCHSCCYGDCAGDDEPYNWDFDLDRAGRAYEIYNNTMEYNGDNTQGYFARIRAGSIIFSGNTVSATREGAKIGQAIQLVCESNNNGPYCTIENGYPVDHSYSSGCNGATDGCCDKVESSYIWNNTLNRVDHEVTAFNVCGSGAISEGIDYFTRAPTLAEDGFEWKPHPYPHPLVDGSSESPPDSDNNQGNNNDNGSGSNAESGCFITDGRHLPHLLKR